MRNVIRTGPPGTPAQPALHGPGPISRTADSPLGAVIPIPPLPVDSIASSPRQSPGQLDGRSDRRLLRPAMVVVGPRTTRAAAGHALQFAGVARKPLGTDEEVILVLSLYFEYGQLPASDPKVVEVSRVMSALAVNVNGDHAGTVRQPGAVAMKLANFSYADYPRGGLRNVGPRDRRFFDTYKDCRDNCHQRARAIRGSVTHGRQS